MSTEIEALCFLAFVVACGFALMFIGVSTKGISTDMKWMMIAEYAIIVLIFGSLVYVIFN